MCFDFVATVQIELKLPLDNCIIPLPCPGILTQICGCKTLANSTVVYPLLAQVEDNIGKVFTAIF